MSSTRDYHKSIKTATHLLNVSIHLSATRRHAYQVLDERESIQGGNLDDFDDMNQQLGDSPLLPAPDSVTDLAYPNWQGHGNGESIPIPIHDQIEETRRMSAWQSIRNTLRSRSSGKSSPSVGRFVLNAEGA